MGELEQLTGRSFQLSVLPTTNGYTLRKALKVNGLVQQLDAHFQTGLIAEPDIQAFVDALLARFEKGTPFRDRLALAAIAVILESRHSPFARKYLRSLSGLRLEELRDAIEVAKECLLQQSQAPSNHFKAFSVWSDDDNVSTTFHTLSRALSDQPDVLATPLAHETVETYG